MEQERRTGRHGQYGMDEIWLGRWMLEDAMKFIYDGDVGKG